MSAGGKNFTTVINNSIFAIGWKQYDYCTPGNSRIEVCEEVGCSYDTLTNWLRKYLQGGLEELVNPIRHQKHSRLSDEQQQQLKEMILTQRPTEYGIERQMWTGAIISEVIAQRFEVELKDSRIYQLRCAC